MSSSLGGRTGVVDSRRVFLPKRDSLGDEGDGCGVSFLSFLPSLLMSLNLLIKSFQYFRIFLETHYG